jgi:hypothetical protein
MHVRVPYRPSCPIYLLYRGVSHSPPPVLKYAFACAAPNTLVGTARFSRGQGTANACADDQELQSPVVRPLALWKRVRCGRGILVTVQRRLSYWNVEWCRLLSNPSCSRLAPARRRGGLNRPLDARAS